MHLTRSFLQMKRLLDLQEDSLTFPRISRCLILTELISGTFNTVCCWLKLKPWLQLHSEVKNNCHRYLILIKRKKIRFSFIFSIFLFIYLSTFLLFSLKRRRKIMTWDSKFCLMFEPKIQGHFGINTWIK